MAPFAFEGIKVLDFTWVAVGPITTKYLADNGADVIKIETGTHIDVLRAAPPYAEGRFGVNRSQFFADYNTSKRSITLNLGHPQAREMVMARLVPWADVVVENFTPKVMRGFGMDYEHLCRVKPGLIMLSSCLQGQTGPQAMMPGFGQLMAALSGFYYISGYGPGEDPAPPYGAYTDYITPRLAAAVLAAALDYRRRTGRGQYIDVSQFEASLHFLAPALIDYFATGRVLQPQGNRSERYAPHGAYRCRDEDGAERWISIAVANDAQWQGLRVLGNPACDQRFATMLGRLRNADTLDAFISELVRDRQAWDLTVKLQEAGVAAYPVQSCLDLHQDDNLEAFGFWNWLEHKEMGPAPYMGVEHRLEATPAQLRSPAPTLGQHTEEILHEMFGLDDAQIAQLRKDGVLA
jgi:benzylsuccinate CoA-transferase BbsF subunit